MTYIAPSTRNTDDLISHTIWNQDVKDNIIAVHDPPSAMVYHSTTQSVPSAGTALSFDSEDYDTASLHDTVTNNSRLTAPIAGVYLATCYLEMTSVTSARYEIELRINGSTTVRRARQGVEHDNIYLTLTTLENLAASDYVELFARNFSGGPETATANCRFGMTWLGAGT